MKNKQPFLQTPLDANDNISLLNAVERGTLPSCRCNFILLLYLLTASAESVEEMFC